MLSPTAWEALGPAFTVEYGMASQAGQRHGVVSDGGCRCLARLHAELHSALLAPLRS